LNDTRRGPPQPWVTLSLFVAVLLLAFAGTPPPAVSLHLIVLTGLLFASLRWRIAPLAIVALVVAGIDLRFAYVSPAGSDVDDVTRAAIARLLAGQSPYGVGYPQSVPPGSPFPYGPLALLWYLPFPSPRRLELFVSIVLLLVLAVRGRPLGLAIYAVLIPLLVVASDGSNDNSAGLLLLIALVSAERWPRVGAAVLGLAIAFKPYALAWVAPFLGWGGIALLWPMLIAAAAFWLPALIAWGPAAIHDSLSGAEVAQLRVGAYYSLGWALKRFGSPIPLELLNTVRLVVGAAASAVAVLRTKTHAGVIIGGTLIFLATLFLGAWSTFAYFAAIAPVLCWYLDDWFGHADDRVDWPAELSRIGVPV
jgi:hypothetical protein